MHQKKPICPDTLKGDIHWKDRYNNPEKEPLIEVGIVSGIVLNFSFNGSFRLTGQTIIGQPAEEIQLINGAHSARFQDGHLIFQEKSYNVITFEPVQHKGASFELFNVSIGINFHWERTEKQLFEGSLTCIVEDNVITAVNRIPLESYLMSVISSEMSANASVELLKAHAVISRSWLLSQMQQKGKDKTVNPGFVENETERIRWYDREDHAHFDVCADDHCQRYQGISNTGNPRVRDAIQATRGQVLCFGNDICDARFSKSCGGVMEEFQHCWEHAPKPYLLGLADRKRDDTSSKVPDLREEGNAADWILSEPVSFCNTRDKKILAQVLNHYDQETTDFFRWQVTYTTEVISRLAHQRSGIDFGQILDLIPLERGSSGRIVRLKIVGSKKTFIIGKELEIRRTLSASHLYSSAFVVEKTPEGFTLHGAGWGHGVGLCQIGAAVMGEQGYSYQSILSHYYPNTELKVLYP